MILFIVYYLSQKFRSITTLAALAIAIVFAWKLLRSPSNRQRRQRKQPGPLPAHAAASSHTNMMVQSSEACTSSGDSRVQDVADEFIQPVKVRCCSLSPLKPITLKLIVLEISSPPL